MRAGQAADVVPAHTARRRSTAELLVAEGTVPMYFQGVKYNIPVAIWLPEQYPLQVGGRAGASAGLRVGARA